MFQTRLFGLYLSAVIFSSVGAGVGRANLLANGGFETGNFSGWTLSNVRYTSVTTSNVYDGTYAYFNGEYAPGSTISQTVATIVGDPYVLTFWLAESSFGYSPGYSFTVSTSASATPLLALSNTPDFGYTEYTERFQPTSTTTTISFAGYNLPGGTYMDDVSLVDSVPEPGTWSLIAMGAVFLVCVRKSPSLRALHGAATGGSDHARALVRIRRCVATSIP